MSRALWELSRADQYPNIWVWLPELGTSDLRYNFGELYFSTR